MMPSKSKKEESDEVGESRKKVVTIVLPCFNEAENIEKVYFRLSAVCDLASKFDFIFQFIDNASTDGTVDVIRKLAKQDSRVRAIVNSRNFGFARSPFYGLLQAEGDCAILMATDLQEPPELIAEFLGLWSNGMSVVVG